MRNRNAWERKACKPIVVRSNDHYLPLRRINELVPIASVSLCARIFAKKIELGYLL